MGGEGVPSDLHVVHDILHEAHKQRYEDCDQIHACAVGQADGGGHPNAGGRGQAAHGSAVFEDNAGAQKRDAGDHLGGNAGGVRTMGTVDVKTAHDGGHVGKTVFGDDHDQRGAGAHDNVRAYAGGLEAPGALAAYDKARSRGQYDAQQDVKDQRKRKQGAEDKGIAHKASPF